jgi:hypothetical protein
MFRRIGTVVVLGLSVLFATVALLLVRPQPMVEFFAGFVGGSLWIFQLVFAAIALLLAGLSLRLERTPATFDSTRENRGRRRARRRRLRHRVARARVLLSAHRAHHCRWNAARRNAVPAA